MAVGTAVKAGGRPRDQRIDQAVLAATLDLLEAEGYHAVSLEAVARRAGTSRPAIYRRWRGRTPLVLAAIADRLAVPESPDTGCTLCDLDESFAVFLDAFRTIRPDALTALYAECAADQELRARYYEAVVQPARNAVAATLRRAAERGDLRPDIDLDLLLDYVASLVQCRDLLGRGHLTRQDAESAVTLLLHGAAVDYPALLAHGQELERQACAEGDTHPHEHG